MLVPKKNRMLIYTKLFGEGVMCAKKDLLGKHHELEVPNLHIINLMKSFHSRGLVMYKFSWQWYYYTLTNEGIEYLREYLHITDSTTVPATLKKSSKQQLPPSFGSGAVEGESGQVLYRPEREERRRFDGDGEGGERRRGGFRGGRRGGFGRDEYRDDSGKTEGAPGGFSPEFSGEGRGRGRGGFLRGRGRGRGRGGHGGAAGGDAPAGAAAAAPAPAAAAPAGNA